MIYYKLRNKDNPEKFVNGTPSYQSYDTIGRIFQTLGQLRTFITGVINQDSRLGINRVSEWEVVELEMVIKEVKGVHEVITQKKLMALLTK